MTDLTEQWKKGELPCGWYWCKCYDEEIKILYYDRDCFELDDPETKNYYFFLKKDCEEITILAPVPTYQEYLALQSDSLAKNEGAEIVAELEEENKQLKELLKECKRQFEEVELCRYDVADDDQEDWFKISTEQASIANKMITKINQALGEDK